MVTEVTVTVTCRVTQVLGCGTESKKELVDKCILVRKLAYNTVSSSQGPILDSQRKNANRPMINCLSRGEALP